MALFPQRMMARPIASESFGCFFKNAGSLGPLKEILNHKFGQGPEIYFKTLPLVILSSLKSKEPWFKGL